MGDFDKPVPIPTPTTQPFWDALAEHKIRIQYSPSAHQYVFYPRVLAPGTLADDLEWREISGAASLYTFTVAYRPVAPHFATDVPQLLAVAQWDEGPRFSTEIVNAEPADLRVGMRLKPVFSDKPEPGVTMLRYEPA
ncbi:Zn-ribbon domain-containing OB-fold protein [Mycolicibacterium sp. P1-5]|uniref:Zn-ribbon domain-containing OB-fold protein n=1 Tax=Mycolicibacterium sp. P1-5 TaxID=2024617 RepID=UPI0011EF60A9|nr:OB-fold domain-containing protein [Mycolicibacterium sp. P1-5]KAA0112051.1 acyl dehydratase [Mycolicibacterium sp. P1-5]